MAVGQLAGGGGHNNSRDNVYGVVINHESVFQSISHCESSPGSRDEQCHLQESFQNRLSGSSSLHLSAPLASGGIAHKI